MATSGSTNFTVTRNEIIRSSLRVIGAISSGETPSSQEITDASEALNMMVKAWAVDGIHLWALEEATLFCQSDQSVYPFPSTYATRLFDYTRTNASIDALAADGSLFVDDTTDILDGYYIGIMLNDGSIHWTTVNGDPVLNLVILNDILPDNITTGNIVYTYKTQLERPLRIRNLRRQDLSGNELTFTNNGMPMSRSDYLALPNKTATGLPIQGYYSPRLDTGFLAVWPTPQDATTRINFTYERTFEDFDAASNNPDFPGEWLSALKWNLALEIWPEYYPKENPSQFILEQAMSTKQALIGWDVDPASTYFEPEISNG